VKGGGGGGGQESEENRDFLLHRIKSDDKLFIDQKAKAKTSRIIARN
jgi:hypothetical protein